METSGLIMAGGLLILVGFLNLIRGRVTRLRRRLTPAASIRSREIAGGSRFGAYADDGSTPARGLSVVLMLGGAAVLLASIITS